MPRLRTGMSVQTNISQNTLLPGNTGPKRDPQTFESEGYFIKKYSDRSGQILEGVVDTVWLDLICL